MDFAGGAPLTGAWGPDPKKVFTVASLNLTPDASGISYYDEKMFHQGTSHGNGERTPVGKYHALGRFFET